MFYDAIFFAAHADAADVLPPFAVIFAAYALMIALTLPFAAIFTLFITPFSLCHYFRCHYAILRFEASVHAACHAYLPIAASAC